MKKLLLLLLFIFGCSAGLRAQVLLTEDFSSLTIGNVGTELTGMTPGQGGWTTYVLSGGLNSDFQVVDKGGVYGNAIQITGSNIATGARIMAKNLAFDWGGRTAGNNIAQVDFSFFTGPVSTSKNSMRVTLYDSNTRTKMLAGMMVTMDTKEVRGLSYYDNTATTGGTLGNYSFTLGGTATTPAPLLLTANTWYKFGFSFNYTTGQVLFKEATGLFNKFTAGAAAGIDVFEVDVLAGAGTSNIVSSIGVFDNINITASGTDTLLAVNTNDIVSNAISVYPNPVIDVVTIVNSKNLNLNAIQITDSKGLIVKNKNLDNALQTKLSLTDLSTGIYFMKISSNEGTTIKKIIKN